MREIYDSIFKDAGIVTSSELTDLWADFGCEIYDKYLRREIELSLEVQQLKDDLNVIGIRLTEKGKRGLSKRILDQIN